jgi:xanthine dehydrogenase YagS FAD-binding subunit
MTDVAGVPEPRAGGTDLSARRRSGVSRGPIADIVPTAELSGIAFAPDGAARIGSLVTVAALAADAGIRAGYPGFAAAAGALATPQIRAIATLGGNLAQRSRCWYFRHPEIACLKKGGAICPARGGNHLYGVAFDLGPCVAPHPSTLAVACLAYEAMVATDQRQDLEVADLFGDGSDGTRDNTLAPGEAIRRVDLPPPVAGERAAYRRAIGRAQAEWPLAEAVVRVVLADGRVSFARIAAGGIAPVPLRLWQAEAALLGVKADAARIARAAALAREGASPLPMTGYKLDLLEGLLIDLLERVCL